MFRKNNYFKYPKKSLVTNRREGSDGADATNNNDVNERRKKSIFLHTNNRERRIATKNEKKKRKKKNTLKDNFHLNRELFSLRFVYAPHKETRHTVHLL